MVQNAVVKKVIDQGVVEVSLLRQMECGMHCDGACAGCGQRPTEEIIAKASDPIGTKPGDHVQVEPSNKQNISTSVVVFLVPCIGLAAGYLTGQTILHLDEVAALGTALLGLVAGFVPAFLMNRTIAKSQTPQFTILKLLG